LSAGEQGAAVRPARRPGGGEGPLGRERTCYGRGAAHAAVEGVAAKAGRRAAAADGQAKAAGVRFQQGRAGQEARGEMSQPSRTQNEYEVKLPCNLVRPVVRSTNDV